MTSEMPHVQLVQAIAEDTRRLYRVAALPALIARTRHYSLQHLGQPSPASMRRPAAAVMAPRSGEATTPPPAG